MRRTWLSNLFSGRRPASRTSPKPTLLQLEDRSTPAVTAILNGGVLTVSLDAANDKAALSVAGGQVVVVDETILPGTPVPGSPFAGVASIVVQDAAANAGQQVTITGGEEFVLSGFLSSTGVETAIVDVKISTADTVAGIAIAAESGVTITANGQLLAGTGPVTLTSTAGDVVEDAAAIVTAGTLSATGNTVSLGAANNQFTVVSGTAAAADFTVASNVPYIVAAPITAANGKVTLTAPAVTVAAGITAKNDVTISATDSAAPGNDLTVNGAVTILSTTGNVSLNAGDRLALLPTALVEATAGNVAMNVDLGAADPEGGIANTVGADLMAAAGATLLGGDNDDAFTVSGTTALFTVDGGGSVTKNTHTFDGQNLDTILTADTAKSAGKETTTFLNPPLFNAVNLGTVMIVGDDNLDDQFDISRSGNDLIYVVNGTAKMVQDFYAAPGGKITVDGLGKNDTLTVRYSGGDPVPTGGIAYDGGADNDTLVVVGNANAQSVVYTPGAKFGDGTLLVNAGTIAFANLAPVVVSGVNEFKLALTGLVENVTVDNAPATQALLITGDSDGTAFESVTLSDAKSLVIDTSAGNGKDVVTLKAATTAHQVIDVSVETGSDATDQVLVTGTNTYAGNVVVNTAGSIGVTGVLTANSTTFTSVGPITVAGTVGATAANSLTSGANIDVSGKVTAGTNNTLAAGTVITVSGLTSGATNALNAGTNITIAGTGTASATGANILTATTGFISVAGKATAGTTNTVNAKTSIDVSGKATAGTDNSLQAGTFITVSGLASGATNSLNAGTNITITGTGTASASGANSLTTGTGFIVVAGNATGGSTNSLNAKTSIDVSGKATAATVNTLQAGSFISVSGQVSGATDKLNAGTNITIAGTGTASATGANSLTAGTAIAVAGQATGGSTNTLTAGAGIDVTGTASAGTDNTLTAGTSISVVGSATAGGANKLSATAGSISVAGIVSGATDTLVAGTDITIALTGTASATGANSLQAKAGSILVAGTASGDTTNTLTAGAAITVSGSATAKTDSTLIAGTNVNVPGTVSAGGNSAVTGVAVTVNGSIVAANDSQVNYTNGDLTLGATGQLTGAQISITGTGTGNSSLGGTVSATGLVQITTRDGNVTQPGGSLTANTLRLVGDGKGGISLGSKTNDVKGNSTLGTGLTVDLTKSTAAAASVVVADVNQLTVDTSDAKNGIRTNGNDVTLLVGTGFSARDLTGTFDTANPFINLVGPNGSGDFSVETLGLPLPTNQKSTSIVFIIEVNTNTVTLGTPGLVGFNQPDSFTVRPSSLRPINVNGNQPTTIPGDTLGIFISGTSVATFTNDSNTGNGKYTFVGGRKDVVFTSIEAFGGLQAEGFVVQTNTVSDSDPQNYAIRFSLTNAGETDIDGSPVGGKRIPANPFVVIPQFRSESGPFNPAQIAFGDFNGDLIPDLIIANGQDNSPLITVINGIRAVQPVSEPIDVGNLKPTDIIAQFYAYDPKFYGGVSVAAGDLDGDGKAEIVTGPGNNGGPHVRIFEFNGSSDPYAAVSVRANFFAFEDSFRGGINVAVGDTTGDGNADVIIGAGFGGGPRVQVLDGSKLNASTSKDNLQAATLKDFFAYSSTFRGGVFVGAGQFTGDGIADILTGPGFGGGSHIKVFDGTSGVLRTEFMAFPVQTGLVNSENSDTFGVGGVAFGRLVDGGTNQQTIMVATPRGRTAAAYRFNYFPVALPSVDPANRLNILLDSEFLPGGPSQIDPDVRNIRDAVTVAGFASQIV